MPAFQHHVKFPKAPQLLRRRAGCIAGREEKELLTRQYFGTPIALLICL
jgi:hypothetical protein